MSSSRGGGVGGCGEPGGEVGATGTGPAGDSGGRAVDVGSRQLCLWVWGPELVRCEARGESLEATGRVRPCGAMRSELGPGDSWRAG